MTACVLTILITAPLGELILFVLGGVLLESDEDRSFGGIVHEIQIHTPTYTLEPPTLTAETKFPPPIFTQPPPLSSSPFNRQMFMSKNEDNMQFRM